MTTVIKNAKIYTMDEENRCANCIVFDKKLIRYVGEEAGLSSDSSKNLSSSDFADAQIYDAKGKSIYPGIIDSHIHPGWIARSMWHVRLPWTEDVNELLDFVRNYCEEHPKEEIPFIYFEYYPTSMFDEKGPTKNLLDKAVSDRPVLCQDFGEHLCWVNSRMLELLKVDKSTPDPSPLEVFVRDEEGNPTGWIKEMAWKKFEDNLYKGIDWRPPEELNPETMKDFFEFLTASGITAMADGFIESDDQIKGIYEMDKAGLLNVYYDGMVRFWNYRDLPEKIEKVREYQRLYTTDHIKVNTMKLFLDGTNESGNSASLHEHINDPGNYGEIMMDTGELVDCLLLCNREKLDLHIHMVGDRAFRVGCDAVEKAQKIAANSGVPWICKPVFAHCEIVDPADMQRPGRLGITINWSCHWSGGYFGEEAMNYYSEDKWRRMYQFNPMIESGAVLACSSDVVTAYEMHRAYPFFGMQVANTRIDPEFPLSEERYPGSVRPDKSACLSLYTLLKGYTVNSAEQLHWFDIMGSLEEGKKANLIITDRDLFESAPDRIKDIEVETVVFDGKVIKGKL